MFPALFDTHAIAASAAAANPLRHHSSTMSRIITKEIQQQDSTTNLQHGVATRRWFAGKDHAHFMKQYNKDFAHKRKQFSPADMDEVHQEYLRDRELRDRRLEEEKWKVIFMLEYTLKDEKYSKIRLAQGDRALYESMFKMEPRKFISRPKFLTTMRLVYGFELANLDAVSNTEMLDRLNILYSSFDVQRNDQMDWRCFVLMLEMCHAKTNTVLQHVKWGYSLYSSQGSFDTSFEEPMRLGDVKDLLATMCKVIYKTDIVELTDAAWASVASRDAEAKGMVKKLQRGDKPMDGLAIPFRLFELMLNQASLKPLFEHYRPWGKLDAGTWTYLMEETYYHPTLLHFIKAERRELKVDKLADLFISQKSLRRKRDAAKCWRSYIWRRKRSRFLMTENIVRYVVDNTSTAWIIFRKWVMREIAVREIQRVIRGYVGRMEAAFLAVLYKSVTLLQATYRGKLARRRYLGITRKRNWAASEMQRHIRGGQARRLGLNKLEGYLDSERIRLKKEKFAWENEELIKAAKSIQNQWRTLQARRRVHLIKDEQERERIIQEAMDDFVSGHKRDRMVYMRQIEEWYTEKRIEHEKNNITAGATKAEMAKIRAYRRKIAADELHGEEDKYKEKLEAMEEKRIEQWLITWGTKSEEESEKYKVLCKNCMIAPDTPLEKKLGKKLIKTIKARCKDVLKRADARHMPMEYPEAYDIATNEVIYIYGEERKKEIMAEMKEAAATYEGRQKRKAKEEEEKYEHMKELDKKDAAKKLGLMYRRWHARKLLRQHCMTRFEKKFSEKYCAFFYLNNRSGEHLWEKPLSLGSYDMLVTNEWRPMRDNQQFPYYYNPSTMRMSWKRPKSTCMCEEKVNHDWEPVYPPKYGPCSEFATRRCNDDMRFYCDTCWERKYNVAQRHKMWWKPVNGATPNSDQISYDDLDDKLDDFPEDDVARAIAEWEAKKLADFNTTTFDPNKKRNSLLGDEAEANNNFDKIMAKSAAPALTAADVANKASSLTVAEMKKNLKTDRQLVSKYSDWMKGGAKGGALAGAIGAWGAAGKGRNEDDKFGHFLSEEGECLSNGKLMGVAFKEWQKFRRTQIYDRKFDLSNPDSKHALSTYQGDAVADLLTQFGVKVKVQVGFSEVDADGDGQLDKGELQAMLIKEFGEENVHEGEVNMIFQRFDTDGGGTLDMEEYEKFKAEYEKEIEKKDKLLELEEEKKGGEGGEGDGELVVAVQE